MSQLRVLMTSEGTYPFYRGGVSTWCNDLMCELADVKFDILAITASPYVLPQYPLPPNVGRVLQVPLWGMNDPIEFGWRSRFASVWRSKVATNEKVIRSKFLPFFIPIVTSILAQDKDMNALGENFLAFHEYLLRYDYQTTMRSPIVWECWRNLASKICGGEVYAQQISLWELAECLRLLYHYFLILQVPLPEVDLVHSSAAAFCGLPGIIAKMRHGTPYLLTEHGINIREQYLNSTRTAETPFVRTFLLRLMGAIVRLNYHYADIIAPVCANNARWERWWGVPEHKIKVIYNGANPEVFKPVPPPAEQRPQVMNMGLIFPLKGQIDLINAAAIVRDRIPDVEFRLYGKPSDPIYYQLCQAKVKEYNLDNTIDFAGFTSEPWRAYSEADVVAMASISEGFPYSIIEAMFSGATIVSTDVGGVSEALGDTGVLVRANRPQQLAEAILGLFALPIDARREYGTRARSRAMSMFTQEQFVRTHLDTYCELIENARYLKYADDSIVVSAVST
jgi:glycosyltransferase involved in cell wall biosynthesis